MTRKEYVIAVTDQLAANPRSVLAGHKIPAAVLNAISARPDVMAKLAAFGFMTKKFNQGAKGLKKTPVLKISGYKNFPDFNKNARTDVEAFTAGLPGPDADAFQNSENIITFIVLPDTATGETEADIVNGKSVTLKFDSAVKKEYSVNGGFYITIMFGDSSIRPQEEKVAVAKAKVNKAKVVRKQRNGAAVKKALIEKAKNKQARLAGERSALQMKASTLDASMAQYASIAKQYGVTIDSPKDIAKAMKAYDNNTKRFLKGLSAAEKIVYNEAMKLMKKGDMKAVNSILKSLGNDQLTAIVKSGNLTTADARSAVRLKELRGKIKGLTAKNEELLKKLEAAPSARAKAQIRFDMKKNVKMINDLKARMGVHKDVSAKTIASKAALLSKTNSLIAENIAKGLTVQESLNAALAKLPVTQEVKQQVKQQIIQQVANQVPTQYAVQQALQQIPVEAIQADYIDLDDDSDLIDVLGDEGAIDAASLVGEGSINSILAFL